MTFGRSPPYGKIAIALGLAASIGTCGVLGSKSYIERNDRRAAIEDTHLEATRPARERLEQVRRVLSTHGSAAADSLYAICVSDACAPANDLAELHFDITATSAQEREKARTDSIATVREQFVADSTQKVQQHMADSLKKADEEVLRNPGALYQRVFFDKERSIPAAYEFLQRYPADSNALEVARYLATEETERLSVSARSYEIRAIPPALDSLLAVYEIIPPQLRKTVVNIFQSIDQTMNGAYLVFPELVRLGSFPEKYETALVVEEQPGLPRNTPVAIIADSWGNKIIGRADGCRTISDLQRYKQPGLTCIESVDADALRVVVATKDELEFLVFAHTAYRNKLNKSTP